MRNKIIVGFILLTVILGFVALTQNREDSTASIYDTYGLDETSTVQMVEKLESLTLNPDDINIGISATTLTMNTADGSYTHEVPDDIFYLSFAPYIDNTHPCGTHNLVTCRGELQNETFDVLVTDTEGNIIFDDTVTSEDNGFKGIWLPRNIEGTITVNYNGLTATQAITTYDDSNTCLTTLQLQ